MQAPGKTVSNPFQAPLPNADVAYETARYKYITSNIPDEYMAVPIRTHSPLRASATLLVPNEQLVLNLDNDAEKNNKNLMPTLPPHGQLKKKQKPKQVYGQKRMQVEIESPMVVGCIESRKIQYPGSRSWIGGNLNNELIF